MPRTKFRSVVASLTLLLSLLVGAPAAAQTEEPDEPDDVDYTSSNVFDKVLLTRDVG